MNEHSGGEEGEEVKKHLAMLPCTLVAYLLKKPFAVEREIVTVSTASRHQAPTLTCTQIKLCKLIPVLRTAKVTRYKSGHGQWSTCRALAGNKVFNSRVQLSIGLIKAFRLKDWVPAKVLPACQ